MREMLIDGFEYEQWANDRWAPLISGPLADHALAQEAVRHMLSASKTWYERTLSPEDMPALSDDPIEALRTMSDAWKELVRTSDPEAYVAYQTRSGDHYFSMVGELARHVVNHGTYHRGELRTYAVQAGLEFPDTDYVLFRQQANTAPA